MGAPFSVKEVDTDRNRNVCPKISQWSVMEARIPHKNQDMDRNHHWLPRCSG